MSRISKFKRIYSEGVVNYSASEEMEESVKIRRGILRGSESQVSRTTGPGALTPDAAAQLGPKAVELQKTKAKQVNVPSFVKRVKKEEVEVKESLKTENPCWKGYKPVGVKMKKGRKVPNCVPEEFELGEAHMTAADKKREDALKDRYDNSDVKKKFIDKYGKEEGTKIYFATIRKRAMEEALELYEAPVQDDNSEDGPPTVSSAEPFMKLLAKNKELAKRRELAKKADELARGLQQGIADDYNYELDEAKISKTERRAKNAGKPGYDRKGFALPPSGDVVTARGKFDNPDEFHKHLKNHGINIPISRIHYTGGMKGGDVGEKKVKVATALANIRKKEGVYSGKYWDTDETKFTHGKKGRPNVHIHVKNPQGETVKKLTNQQYNTYELKPGESHDYTEFGSAKKFRETSSPNKKVIARLKKSLQRGWGRRGRNRSNAQLPLIQTKMSMVDDAAKVHKAFKRHQAENPTSAKIKTILAKPNKKGEVMTTPYRPEKRTTIKAEFELWVNALLDEGYDLSEFTIDELYEGYEELLDEAITAVAAPAPGGDKKPYKKAPRPKLGLDYTKKYTKKEVKEEVVEVSPYEFWKSFIGEEEEVSDETIVEETEEVIERTPTSYDYWKAKLQEGAGSEDRGERHVAKDAAMRKRDPNQKTTTITTASRPGNSPSMNLPISSVPHVHTPTSNVK